MLTVAPIRKASASRKISLHPQRALPTIPVQTVLTCNTTAINVTATGGGSYSWDNGLGTDATVSLTAEGTYTVTVTGANGCTDTESIDITQDIVPPVAGITNNTGTTVLTCNTTAIDVTATEEFIIPGPPGRVERALPKPFNHSSGHLYGDSNSLQWMHRHGKHQHHTGYCRTHSWHHQQYCTTVLTCNTTAINVTATGGGSYSWDNGLGTDARSA
jgi:hypothetical protein